VKWPAALQAGKIKLYFMDWIYRETDADVLVLKQSLGYSRRCVLRAKAPQLICVLTLRRSPTRRFGGIQFQQLSLSANIFAKAEFRRMKV